MQVAVMDMDDETTMFIGLTRENLLLMARVAESGGVVLPAINIAELGEQMETDNPITLIQISVDADEEAFIARCESLAEALNIGLVNRGYVARGGSFKKDADDAS